MADIKNLTDLTNYLKAVDYQTPKDAFKGLKELVGSDLRITYENTKTTNDTNNTDGPNGPTCATRFLLSTIRLYANYNLDLAKQCNGVVLEYPSWKVISLPSAKINPHYRLNDVIKKLDSYEIYNISDGTTVTLYYYNNAWCMSSTNGFDVRDYRWQSETTYWEAFIEVTKLYPEFSLDKLDTSVSYTVAFRHHHFHPLATDPQRAWLVCATSIENAAVSYPNIGLPLQVAIAVTGDEILEKNKTALSRYLTTVREGKPEIHYGYVLRATGTDSDIILESELLKTVRGLVYNLPKNTNVVLNHTNRLEYMILKSYLSCKSKFNFINLFPQFDSFYKKYDALFKELSSDIITAMRRTDRASKSKLVTTMVRHIESHDRINAMDSQGINIINDFIMNQKYIDIYFTLLVCNK
jgi:hypothetical protein